MTKATLAGRRRQRLIAGLAAIAVASGGFIGWKSGMMNGSHAATATAPPPAVPVEIATAERRDVPLYLTGLGTVQAFNTVTMKARVDGELQKVAFTEGQNVKAGDLLAQIDPRPYQAALDQAVAKKVQDDAQLANAKLDLQRYTELAARSFSPKQQLDTQRAMVAQLGAQIRGDQAAIDNAQTQLGYTTITSPLTGRIGIRVVDQGNIVRATDTNGIVVVTQIQPISVVFTLPEDDLQSVSQAMAQGPVVVAALSRDGKTELDRGTLLLVDNQIDQTTGTIRLKATFPNPRNALWPGQFVNAQLLLQTEHNVLTVPSAAIQRGPDGLFTYIVKPDSTVDMRAIAVGQETGAIAVIDSGLAGGDRVVTAGQYRVQPGTLVQIGTANPQVPEAGQNVAQRAQQ
jgi:multidrug efflux system membrane fusion protein